MSPAYCTARVATSYQGPGARASSTLRQHSSSLARPASASISRQLGSHRPSMVVHSAEHSTHKGLKAPASVQTASAAVVTPMDVDQPPGSTGGQVITSHTQDLSSKSTPWSELLYLNSIFNFPDMPAAQLQSEAAANFYSEKFKTFVEAMTQQAGAMEATPPEASIRQTLASSCSSFLQPDCLSLLKVAATSLDASGIIWLPDFGCAVLPLPAPGHQAAEAAAPEGDSKARSSKPVRAAVGASARVDELALYLVFLDCWQFKVDSFNMKRDAIQHTAYPTSSTCIYSGSIPAATLPDLGPTLWSIITAQKEQKRKQKDNPQASKGFQHTPAFIAAVVTDAIDKLQSGTAAEAMLIETGTDNQVNAPQQAFTFARGGTTDVGQHTGGIPRDTSWPLVKQVILALMQLIGGEQQQQQERWQEQQPEIKLLFAKAMLHFELWIVQQLAQSITADTATRQRLNSAMAALQSVARQAAALAVDHGQDIAAVEAACSSARAQLEAAMAQRQLQAAAHWHLPACTMTGDGSTAGRWVLPSGAVPSKLPICSGRQDFQAVLLRAEKNLGALPYVAYNPMQPLRDVLLQLLQLLQHCSSVSTAVHSKEVAMQHGLASVEAVFFGTIAPALAAVPATGTSSSWSGLGLTEGDAELLSELVDAYRLLLQAFQATTAAMALMQTELRSRELLVTWTAYCVVFQLARTAPQHAAVVSQYGVGLSWEDLRHLVLSDRTACDAALSISSYLLRFNKQGLGLFNLQQPQPTFQMAQKYTASSKHLSDWLTKHQHDAARRVQLHWDEVKRKQRRAAALRSELQNLRSNRQQLEDNKSHEYNRHGCSSHYYKLDGQISSLSDQINSKAAELHREETPPEPVIQPLPESTSLAQQWMFFLHMPLLLRNLARMSCLAQQLLLPAALLDNPVKLLAVEGLDTSLAEHYNTYQQSSYHTGSVHAGSDGPAGNVMLRSSKQVPASLGPAHVDSMYSDRDGVWWPDSLAPSMAWQGSGCAADKLCVNGLFNPFVPLPNSVVVDSFTEELKSHDPAAAGLQWAMPQYGSVRSTAPERSNIGVCQQGAASGKLNYLTKAAYLELTNLRSYPLRQLHRLCVALREKNLQQALGKPAVQMIIKQAVYHLGTLTAAEGTADYTLQAGQAGGVQVVQLWRNGWDTDDSVLQALCLELQLLADELDPKPREHDAVLLLGELAAYLSDWHAPCWPVARRFAAMTSRVAAELQLQIRHEEQSGNDAVACQLIAKQCRAWLLSLLCHSSGQLIAADACHMMQLIAQIKHGDIYLAGDAEAAADLAQLRVRCHRVMCQRLSCVSAILAAQTQLLTAAVGAVLERVPASLQWKQLSSSSSGRSGLQLLTSQSVPVAAYQAEGSDGHLYSFNVLDGTVLLDGSPPGRLPLEITEHPLYVRTFGSVNFRVAKTREGDLCTLNSIHGRYYSFYLAGAHGAANGTEGEQVVITELDTTQQGSKLKLELLDVGRDGKCGQWGKHLPLRLQELYSHWICRQQQVIVLRPPAFQDHNVQFIIKYAAKTSTYGATPAAGAESLYTCWKVLHHLTTIHWQQLLAQHTQQLTAQQLVLPQPDSRIVHVLSKFEQCKFIHAFIPDASGRAFGRQQAAGTFTAGSCFHLPRFNLEFELQTGGRLASRDFKDYVLSQEQQLVSGSSTAAAAAARDAVTASSVQYTLPGFHQYIVLQHQCHSSTAALPGSSQSSTLVLVPDGEVVQVNQGADGQAASAVGVMLSDMSAAQLKAHTYEVHGRFGHLRAPSGKLACLQLAALYAATSSLLPEPGSHATGVQIAMQLLRESWSNQPLTAKERSHLQSISDLGGHIAPALRLLAYDCVASSEQLRHLHTGTNSSLASTAATGAPVMRPGQDPHAVQVPAGSVQASDTLKPDDAIAYQLQSASPLPGGFAPNPRLQLSAPEEQWLLHTAAGQAEQPAWRRFDLYNAIDQLPRFPVNCNFVASAEQDLEKLVVPARGTAVQQYPLYHTDELPLQQQMHQELENSWKCHHSCPESTEVVAGAARSIQRLHASAQQHRQAAETYLLQHLSNIPSSIDLSTTASSCKPRPASCFRLLRLSADAPAPATLDLLRCALQPGLMASFNPFLSAAAQQQLLDGVLVWLQLCVLEDRLSRLLKLAQAGPEMQSLLVRELLVKRIWDPAAHPKWLVFEAEGQLQIRPAQYHIAQQLMDEPGAITQLHMGEGKTRVILPMLAMHWADGSRLVRLNFLSKLLPEAHTHLAQVLTASVLGIKLFTQPFHRHVSLTVQTVRAMRAALNYCQQAGGLLLVAPEHRLSLQHKWRELWDDKASAAADVCAELKALDGMNYLDLLDESDELLHHRYQLVYAVGDPQELPNLEERVAAVQAVTRVLCQMVDAEHPAVADDRLAVWQTQATRQPGAMCGLQLLPGKRLDAAASQLELAVAKQLMQHPPHDLRWLAKHPNQAAIVSCITDKAVSANQLLSSGSLAGLPDDHKAQLLALRGLLTSRLLTHCLQKRHRVDYGVSRLPGAQKRLAVPFRAADTPAERSEFAQPDVALLLTHLAYYSDGLSLKELKDAVQVLLRMGGNAQIAFYDKEWLPLSRPYMPAEDLLPVDSVAKLDLTNAQQLQLLHKYFSHNQAAVDFFLKHCVLPSESRQYSYRLTGTSWHLANNAAGAIVGFSGTNDHHRLLPMQLHQADQADMQLQGTNGKMLDLLLRGAKYGTLKRTLVAASAAAAAAAGSCGEAETVPVWQLLLDAALKHKVDAVLDCGAVLAGTESVMITRYLLKHMDTSRYRGVCFYCASSKQWMIQDTQGRCSPRQASNLAEADCFVVFDDGRCRGADLKLRQTAVGLLTVAPALQKDKLMQAAGRMRQLGRGQTLLVMGLPDVTDSIWSAAEAVGSRHPALGSHLSGGGSSSHEPGMLQLLQWAMDNTVKGSQAGVPEWASQGMHFAATSNAPERALQPEKLQLDELYGSRKTSEAAGQMLAALADHHRLWCEGSKCSNSDSGASDDLLFRHSAIAKIEQKGKQLAQGYWVLAGHGVNEEVERELQQEEEVEEEVEREVPLVTAAAENDWHYDAVLTAGSVKDLCSTAGSALAVLQLSKVVRLLGAAGQVVSLAGIVWSPKVYCTTNFVHTTATSSHQSGSATAARFTGGTSSTLDEYLRPVDALLFFPATGEALLLSEREADAMQGLVVGVSSKSLLPVLSSRPSLSGRICTTPPPCW